LKGGFSVVLGGLIAFLPLSQLVKKPHKTLAKKFINSSMEFRISKLTISKKNVVLIR
jgi:ribosomal protein S1